MFVLSTLKSMVRIDPKNFNRSLAESISEALNGKLSNKVVKDIGEFYFRHCGLLKYIASFIFPF